MTQLLVQIQKEKSVERQTTNLELCDNLDAMTRFLQEQVQKQQQQQQQQEQQQIINKKTKTVAFANQTQEPAQEQQQQPKGKMLSKRQAKKYDAQIEAVEAASILASIAAAAASASKKERTPPYWTRQHEKAKAGARLQKAMSSVLQSDYEIEFVWEVRKKGQGYTSFPDQNKIK